MLDKLLSLLDQLVIMPEQGMVHPGLPTVWVLGILVSMILITLYIGWSIAINKSGTQVGIRLQWPLITNSLKPLLTRPWLLLTFRLLAASVFLLVIYAGLFGTPVSERNLATVLTWTIWWSGVVMSIFFVGSAWCAICPWDAIATWLVRRHWWRRGDETTSLNLRVPKIFRSIWPALWMFIGLTWLELGAGVTVSPYATALLALLMVVLATISLAVYERKAFCRYFCAVGRTIGAYSSVAPIALRPVQQTVCDNCKTLECYHGTRVIEPCPTHLVMGRMTQNTYCTSCGACNMSCPHQNVAWQIRGIGDEITHATRPHWDEAWFILGLVALTVFHGFTMMPYWEGWMQQLAYRIGDSGQLLISFSIGMLVSMLIPISLYMLCVYMIKLISGHIEEYKRIFSALAFSILPLAFTYHIAHNLTHLVRESHGFWSVLINPLGTNTQPLSMSELHMRHMNPLLSNDVVFALQGMLVLFGFWLAVRIARQRVLSLPMGKSRYQVSFIMLMTFICTISLLNLWLLMQPMIMRM